MGAVDRECIDIAPALLKRVSLIVLLPTSNLSEADGELLASSYKAACEELVAKYGVADSELEQLSDPLSMGLLKFFFAGQRTPSILTRYVVYQTLQYKFKNRTPAEN